MSAQRRIWEEKKEAEAMSKFEYEDAITSDALSFMLSDANVTYSSFLIGCF